MVIVVVAAVAAAYFYFYCFAVAVTTPNVLQGFLWLRAFADQRGNLADPRQLLATRPRKNEDDHHE